MAWSFPKLQNYEAGMDAAGKRFLVHATINGKPATLALDTGAEGLVLFKPAADRLDLKLTGIPSDLGRQNGKFPVLETKPYDVSIFNTNGKLPLLVTDFSVKMDVDGIAGWPLFKNSILQIDAAGRSVKKSLGGAGRSAPMDKATLATDRKRAVPGDSRTPRDRRHLHRYRQFWRSLIERGKDGRHGPIPASRIARRR